MRARVAKLEEEVAEQSKEVTNAQWSLRRAGEQEDALRARVAKLEAICRSAGVCMSCLYGPPDPIGCTDCLGTGWDGGSPYDQIKVLEARVAKLEAALKPFADAHLYYNDAGKPDDLTTGIGVASLMEDFRQAVSILVEGEIARAALKDAPQ